MMHHIIKAASMLRLSDQPSPPGNLHSTDVPEDVGGETIKSYKSFSGLDKKPIECPVCCRSFRTQGLCRRHLRYVHDGAYNVLISFVIVKLVKFDNFVKLV